MKIFIFKKLDPMTILKKIVFCFLERNKYKENIFSKEDSFLFLNNKQSIFRKHVLVYLTCFLKIDLNNK